MGKMGIKDLKVQGKRVVMRVDFNVPLDSDLNILDATRIEATLPSIRYVLDQGGSCVLMSHLGRPGNEYDPELSLSPCAKFLSKVLGREVPLAPDCVGEKVKILVNRLKPGEILLLENLRFHRAEEHPDEDPEFANELASYGDFYVNEAFGSAHRKHSSTYTIATHFPGRAAAGLHMASEVAFLREALTTPKRPFVAVIGGAKVSGKLGVLKSLVKKVDALLIGGGMSFTFLKAEGKNVGATKVEEELLPIAKEILATKKVVLPLDVVAADEESDDAKIVVTEIEHGIPDGFQGFDIGPQTMALFAKEIAKAGTVLWNGPMGVFELERFATGTQAVARAMAQSSAETIVAGGDTIAAVGHLKEKMTHISTGGGATLDFIEKGTLPGIEVLSEKTAPALS